MDYNLKVIPGEIKYGINESMPYGVMPNSMLIGKFEETDMGNDEDIYDYYARDLLVDQRPDQNKFEHEESRGGVNRSSGRLQLQYYGHRGNAEDPSHPEMFLDDLERDPRGTADGPDMKELRKQENARMRFVRWDKDGSDHITGGGRSETQAMADQQTVFKIVRDRLKVFNRQIDGRTPETQRRHKHKSCINKTQLIQSYGDYIKDYSVNPQRRANIICKQVLRDSRAFREETADADFEIAKYTQLCRRRQTANTHNATATAQMGSDGKFAAEDASKHFKTCGLLMANIIKGKRQGAEIVKNSDMDFADAQQTVARKTVPFARDLAIIVQSIAQETRFGTHDNTLVGKNAAPVMAEHLVRNAVYNHSAPAHHYLNAEVLYKSIKPGADTRKIKDKVISDANAPQLRDLNTVSGQSAKMKIITGAKLKTTEDAEKFESTNTVNYKHKLGVNGDRRIRVTSGEDYAKESDDTQDRKRNHANYRNPNAKETVTGISFLDNSSKERHTGGLGTKYMHKYIDRDGQRGESFGERL